MSRKLWKSQQLPTPGISRGNQSKVTRFRRSKWICNISIIFNTKYLVLPLKFILKPLHCLFRKVCLLFLCPRVNGDASLSHSWFDITCDPPVSPVKWEGLGGGRASLDSDSELDVLEIRLLLHLLVHQQHPPSQKKKQSYLGKDGCTKLDEFSEKF